MSEYVASVTLNVSGQEITDFKGFKPPEEELAVPVNLMNKTGSVSKFPRLVDIEIDYVVPQNGRFAFRDVKDARLTVEYDGGYRETYTGVRVLKISPEKLDGDKELVQTITLMAENKITE